MPLPRRSALGFAACTLLCRSVPARPSEASLPAQAQEASLPAQAREASLDVTMIGDWGREGHDEQRAVAAAMGRWAGGRDTAWTLSLGDNFYEDGVSGVDDPQWQDSFERIYDAPALRRRRWWSILGNHDYRGSVQAQLEYGAARDRRWSMPARYYSRRERLACGTRCDLFHLDTNPFLHRYRGSKVRIDGQDAGRQLAWLEQALGQSDADWKIVIGHHPIHTADGAPTEEPELIAAVQPLLERHRVRIYINGHIHNLQHVRAGGVNFITNGAGSRLSRTYPAQAGGWSSAQHGFMAVSVSRSSFDFRFIGTRGETLYQAALDRTG